MKKKKAKTSKKSKSKLKCFIVFVRSSRKSKWKMKDTIIHFSEHIARMIAASKNRNKWVKVVSN